MKLANKLGLFFQIRDDYANLKLTEYAVNKSFAEDLTEGKFSFPIIHAILCRLYDSRLLNILKQRTESEQVKRYAIEYMNECGSFEYTLAALKTLRDEMLREVEELGGNDVLVSLIQSLSKDVLGDKTSPKQSPTPTPTATSAPPAAVGQKLLDDKRVPDEKQTNAKAVHG